MDLSSLLFLKGATLSGVDQVALFTLFFGARWYQQYLVVSSNGKGSEGTSIAYEPTTSSAEDVDMGPKNG